MLQLEVAERKARLESVKEEAELKAKDAINQMKARSKETGNTAAIDANKANIETDEKKKALLLSIASKSREIADNALAAEKSVIDAAADTTKRYEAQLAVQKEIADTKIKALETDERAASAAARLLVINKHLAVLLGDGSGKVSNTVEAVSKLTESTNIYNETYNYNDNENKYKDN